jgi:hypothetical protein
MNPQLSPLKAGDTFAYAGTCKLPVGVWTATCELRTRDKATLVGTVTVALGTAVNGETPITLSATATATASWVTGIHEMDIRYQDSGGVVVHSPTILVPILKATTAP